MKYSNPHIPEGINSTETNPLKEFLLLTSAVVVGVIIITAVIAMLVDSIAEYIPFEFEQTVARQVTEKLNKGNAEVDGYLQHLSDQIVPFMDLPEGVKIKLHYVNDDVVNAMATLGGHIILYRGLLEKLPNENALVMLLGHEIGHVKMRHPVKALGKGVIISLLMSAVLGESSDAVATVISDTSMLTMLGYSREQEQLSDEAGLHVMHAFYGHVKGATNLFEVLQQQNNEQVFKLPQFLNSHPDTGFRIKYLKQLAETKRWDQQGKINFVPDYILNILAEDKKVIAELQEPV